MTPSVAKAEIHCHIEGAAAPDLVRAQARKYGVDVAPFLNERGYVWSDFTSFLAAYDAAAALFRTAGDYALLAETYLTGIAAEGAICQELPFGRAYHTPQFKPLADAFREYFRALDFGPGRVPLYSARSAAPFPDAPDDIRELAAQQWENPVRFTETIERLYADGFRVFLEVGPSASLTAFVSDTLRGRDGVMALSTNSRRKSDLTHLQQTLAQLFVAGVEFDAARLYAHRRINDFDLLSDPRPAPPARPRPALTMPEVTVWRRPNGLPIATTKSPTSSLSESPMSTAVRSLDGIRSTATSLSGSEPTSSASSSRSSARRTLISSAWAMTWWLVRTRPCLAFTITPEPRPRTSRSGTRSPKNWRKFGSLKNGCWTWPLPLTRTLTTAGVTCLSMGAKLGRGSSATAWGSAA